MADPFSPPRADLGPPPRVPPGLLPLVAGGLVTTVLALVVLVLSNGSFFLDFRYVIFPGGAFAYGAGAGSGVVIAALITGYRPRRLFLICLFVVEWVIDAAILLLMFRFPEPDFVTSIQLATHTLGFGGGAVALAVWLRSKDYCLECNAYMRSRSLLSLPEIGPRGEQLPEPEHAAIKLLELAGSGEIPRTLEIIQGLRPESRTMRKDHRHVRVNLVWCRRCHHGALRVSLFVREGRATTLIPISQALVSPAVVNAILSSR